MSNRARVQRFTKSELLKKRGQFTSCRIMIDSENVVHVRFFSADDSCFMPISLNGSERQFKTIKSLQNFLLEFKYEPVFVCSFIENRH